MLLGMIKKNGMHGLAYVVVASKAETEVAHSSADMRSWQMLLDPFRSTDEIPCIAIMLRHSSRNGQHIGIEDDVLWRKSNLVDQQAIGTPANLDASLVCIRLPLLIESHHDGSSSHVPDFSSM